MLNGQEGALELTQPTHCKEMIGHNAFSDDIIRAISLTSRLVPPLHSPAKL